MVSTKETIMATLDRPDGQDDRNNPMAKVGAVLSLEQQLALRHYKDQIDNLEFNRENFKALQQMLYQSFQMKMAQTAVTKQLMKNEMENDADSMAEFRKKLG